MTPASLPETGLGESACAREAPPATGSPGRALHPVRGYTSDKGDYLSRLKKIEGQVRGLQRMIEADKWCPDIVTQVASATRALQEVAVVLLSEHLRHCVLGAARSEDGKPEVLLDEVAGTIRQVVRL